MLFINFFIIWSEVKKMWSRWTREFYIQFQWMKRDIVRRWKLDTPTGVAGILVILSAILLFIVIGSGIARIFRSFVPWVSGSRAGEIYWYSISFGIKASFLFIVFSVSLIILLLHKFSKRR